MTRDADTPVRLRTVGPIFRLERRIHRVDKWEVPIPGGIPLRAIVGGLATLALIWFLGLLPGFSILLDALMPPIRWVLLPIAGGFLASQATPDGRAAHRWLATWLAFPLRSRRRIGARAATPRGQRLGGPLRVGADASLRGGQAIRVTGPAVVRFPDPVIVGRRGPGMWWAQPAATHRHDSAGEPVQEFDLLDGEILEHIP